nr:MAG TPA: hypothetical protein [Caudoviricetes sp.]
MTDKNEWFVAKEKLMPLETDGVKAISVEGEWTVRKVDFPRYMSNEQAYRDLTERYDKAKKYSDDNHIDFYHKCCNIVYVIIACFVCGALITCIILSSLGAVQDACGIGFAALAVWVAAKAGYDWLESDNGLRF